VRRFPDSNDGVGKWQISNGGLARSAAQRRCGDGLGRAAALIARDRGLSDAEFLRDLRLGQTDLRRKSLMPSANLPFIATHLKSVRLIRKNADADRLVDCVLVWSGNPYSLKKGRSRVAG
jgi:hypothetical protein